MGPRAAGRRRGAAPTGWPSSPPPPPVFRTVAPASAPPRALRRRERLGPGCRRVLAGPGAGTARPLASPGLPGLPRLTDPRRAQLALSRLKLRRLQIAAPEQRLAVLGHAPMSATLR